VAEKQKERLGRDAHPQSDRSGDAVGQASSHDEGRVDGQYHTLSFIGPWFGVGL
jgi:hypothetical protein